MSFIWFVLLTLTTVIVLDRRLSTLSNSHLYVFVLPLLCFLFFVGLHYILSANSTFWKIGILYGMCWVVSAVFWPGIPFLGGSVLQFIGIGGSLPVTMLVKAKEPGTTQVIAKELKGCLILVTGDAVLFSPADHPEKCGARPALMNTQISSEPHEMVERYALSDVLKLSQLPQSKREIGTGAAGGA
jgi:hypothetical protein